MIPRNNLTIEELEKRIKSLTEVIADPSIPTHVVLILDRRRQQLYEALKILKK